MNQQALRLVVMLLSAVGAAGVCAQQVAPTEPSTSKAAEQQPSSTPEGRQIASATGKKYALLVCGLSGDADRHKSFVESLEKLHTGLTTQLGFASADVSVLFGDEPQDSDPQIVSAGERATREQLEQRAKWLRDHVTADDSVWVIVLGHSHYDGRNSWLNLPGSDIHQSDFGKLFQELCAGQQVFVMTTPTSGFYVKPLSTKGRVIITATQADWETNETEFPHEFARVLAAPPPAAEFDIDRDGSATLFDLFLTVTRNLAQSYFEREFLATEHALLDDNGDGRGTEVQIDYLNEEQGGRARAGKPVSPSIAVTADGALARAISLPLSQ